MNRDRSGSRPPRGNPRRPLFFRRPDRSGSQRRRSIARSVRIGIDTGGTFTDFVCVTGDRLLTHKRLSTPDDPARGVVEGVRELLTELEGARRLDAPTSLAALLRRIPDLQISYGSTVATNAVLERKGARVVLLTTAGFEDLLEIGRQDRPVLYTLEPRKPAPLVPRARLIGVAERIAFDGAVLVRLTPAGVRKALAAVRRSRADSVAICFLHAYANPAHERIVGRALRPLGLPCSLSHELVAEYREYERLSTTVMNAYVAPVMSRHLDDLRRGVGRAALRVTQSNGGAISVGTASREPVRTLLSGPAGGIIGAWAVAQRLGLERIITFDMGGTSTDVSLIDGAPVQHTEWSIAALPVKVPAIDIHTVGAGGGSLATRDPGGLLKVGPESAGANPGPACYGIGDAPTVTDADVVLGRLVADAFLGGGMSLDVDRSRQALARLGRVLGLDLEATAEGVVRVVNAGMERAVRRISVERGHDPRVHVLVSFGGAAGMHACELALALGISRVLVPYHPGLLSAWGALSAPVQRDYVQTVRLVAPQPAALAHRVAPMVRRARADLRREVGGGARQSIETFLDVRYRGQSYEVRVPMGTTYRETFHAAHQRLYGYRDSARPVEVVNLRVTATVAPPPIPRLARPITRSAGESHRVRWHGRWLAARRLERLALPARRPIAGPLLLTELSATTFVPPAWTATALPDGELMLKYSNDSPVRRNGRPARRQHGRRR